MLLLAAFCLGELKNEYLCSSSLFQCFLEYLLCPAVLWHLTVLSSPLYNGSGRKWVGRDQQESGAWAEHPLSSLLCTPFFLETSREQRPRVMQRFLLPSVIAYLCGHLKCSGWGEREGTQLLDTELEILWYLGHFKGCSVNALKELVKLQNFSVVLYVRSHFKNFIVNYSKSPVILNY